jgi:acetyl-CoA acyltransferase
VLISHFSKGHLGAAVVGSNPELMNKPIMRVEGACASGGLAFASAVEAIKAGCDVTLAVGAEVQTTTSARQGGEYLARASHFKRQSSIDDFVFPAMFARRIKGCLEAGIITNYDLALLSVKAYGNANKNPLAHMHSTQMTLEMAMTASDKNPNFLGNPELSPYLKMSDCSQVSDGGAGVILCSEEGLAKLGKRPEDCIELLGLGHATGNLYTDSEPTEMGTTGAAARVAFQEAGVAPADVEVGEVHDCFTVSEILMMEAIGFTSKVKGGIRRCMYPQ